MPMYRTGIDRFEKYSVKYVPDTVRDRFAQVESVAKRRAQAGLLEWGAMQDIIRGILNKYGVTATDRAKYIGFANKLLKHMLKHGGESAKLAAEGLKQYYVTFLKADPTILDEIIQVITGWVVPY